MTLALDVSTHFAAEFLELLCSQQYAALGRFFLAEASPDHQSSLTNVDASGRLDVYRGAEIPDALNRIFAPIARKAVVVEDVAASTISAGVTAVVTFTSASLSGTLAVVLEHVDDETYFARDVTVSVTTVADVPAPVVETSATPVTVVVEEQPAAAAEPEVVAAVEEAAPVVEVAVVTSAPTTGKSRKGKKAAAPAAAAPAAQIPHEPVEAPVEATPQEEAPAVVETPAPVPVVEVAAPVAPPVATGPKSWASLARTPASAPSAAAPVKVRPPGAEAPAEAVAPVVPAKDVKPKPAEAAPRVEDRLTFNIQGEVSDDDIKAALGPLSKSLVSLRNRSSQGRVFMDFSVSTAFDSLSKASITIGGFPVNFERQRPKA